jgi:uncharacterized MAPEG superfamily protein
MHLNEIGSVELQMLWLSTGLGLVQVVLTAVSTALAGGTFWAISARDQAGPPLGKVGLRVGRALTNYLETFALFAAAVLMANALGKHTAMSALGAQLYFWTRVAYVPVYAAGIPVLRTLVWFGSFAGIVLVLLAAYPGM